jgi:hypothetical protein
LEYSYFAPGGRRAAAVDDTNPYSCTVG